MRLHRRYLRRRLFCGAARFAGAQRDTNTEHACAEEDGEKITERYRKPRKRRENDENAEEDEHAGAGHIPIISGCHNHDKLSTEGVGMRGEMRLQFFRRAGDYLFVNLGEFAGDRYGQHLVLAKFFKQL